MRTKIVIHWMYSVSIYVMLIEVTAPFLLLYFIELNYLLITLFIVINIFNIYLIYIMGDDAIINEFAVWETSQIVFYTQIQDSLFKIKNGTVLISQINKIVLKQELDAQGFEEFCLEIITSKNSFYVGYQIDMFANKLIKNNFFTEDSFSISIKSRIPIVLYEKKNEK